MQKDFQAFMADKSPTNAAKVLKHINKISAQCIYEDEIREATEIFNNWILSEKCESK